MSCISGITSYGSIVSASKLTMTEGLVIGIRLEKFRTFVIRGSMLAQLYNRKRTEIKTQYTEGV